MAGQYNKLPSHEYFTLVSGPIGLLVISAPFPRSETNHKQRQHWRFLSVSSDYQKAEFLDEMQIKVLRVFLLAIQSHLCSFALRYLFLQTHATSYSFFIALLYTVKEKEGKPDRKQHHPV
jgi:hypothetical protein